MRRHLLTALIAVLLIPTIHALAQDNILTNGGLEQGEFGPYRGKGRGDLTVPNGWDIWLGQGSTDPNNFINRGDKVYAFPHPGPGPAPVEGSTAANLNGGYVQFNAAYFQTVGVASGTNLRAEAASNIKACDTPNNEPGFCGSDPSSGAQTRIGIDPDGGSDPNAPEIVWSAWLTPHDRWDRQAVEATATGNAVTVFIYATQDKPYTNNQVYWDDVKLFAGGGGGAAEGEEGEGEAESIAPAPPPNVVPFVNPQGEQDDGSIVHVVQQGDTLDSIAVAYGLNRDDLIERNPSLGSIRFLNIGQRITIQEAPEPEEDEETVPATRAEEDEEAAPIPGAVATDDEETEGEEEVAPLPEDDEEGDVVLNDDPKGINEDDTEQGVDTESALSAISGLLGRNAAPDNTNGADSEDAMDDTEATEETDDTEDTDMTEEPASTEATEETDDTENTDMTEEPEATEPPTTVADAQALVTPTVVPSVDVVSSDVAVCVSVFEDGNQNRLREDNEALLAGGTITLTRDGEEAATYETDGVSEPFCLTDLSVGEYSAAVTPPAGYGLTTPAQLRLPLTAGAALNIEIGAAEGVEVAAVPPPDEGADLGSGAEEVLPSGSASLTDNLFAISGIVVAVLAGIVVIAGIGAAVLLRRSN